MSNVIISDNRNFINKALAKRMHQEYINNYNKEHYANVSFRVKKDEDYYRFREILKNSDVSVATFFKDVIKEFLEMDTKIRYKKK